MAEYGSTSVSFNKATTQDLNKPAVNPFSGKKDFRFSLFSMVSPNPLQQEKATSAFCLSA